MQSRSSSHRPAPPTAVMPASAGLHLTTHEALSGIFGSISLAAWIFLLVPASQRVLPAHMLTRLAGSAAHRELQARLGRGHFTPFPYRVVHRRHHKPSGCCMGRPRTDRNRLGRLLLLRRLCPHNAMPLLQRRKRAETTQAFTSICTYG